MKRAPVYGKPARASLPSDRTPDRAAAVDKPATGNISDTIALSRRELTDEQRAEEAALIRKRIGRVRIRGGDETDAEHARVVLLAALGVEAVP